MTLIVDSFMKVNRRKTTAVLSIFGVFFFFISSYSFVYTGKSYTAQWLNDVMGFIDVANRIHLGQIPYKDFHMIYGPLVALIPGIGLDIGFNAGQIFGFGGVVVATILLLLGTISLPCRLTTAASFVILLFAVILVVVPMGDAQNSKNVTWGTFYNRQCWAFIVLMFLFFVEPEKIVWHDKWTDAFSLSILTILSIYTKFTYGMVAAAFVTANVFVSSYNRKVAIISMAFTIFIIIALEVIFKFHAEYIGDILWMGIAWGKDITSSDNFFMLNEFLKSTKLSISYIGFSISVYFLYASRYNRYSIVDALYVFGVIVATLLLRMTVGAKSVEAWSNLSIVSIFVCVGELARRVEYSKENSRATKYFWARHDISLVCLFTVFVFISGEVINRTIVWRVFVNESLKENNEHEVSLRLSSIIAAPDYIDHDISDNALPTGTYMKTVLDGTKLLLSLNQHDKSVVTFDMVNPFPYAADMIPPVGGYPLFWAFLADEAALPSPPTFFRNVDYVMVPHVPYGDDQLSTMTRLYGAYLAGNYTMIDRSLYWTLWESDKIKADAVKRENGRQSTINP